MKTSAIKSCFDVAVALAALVVLAPVIAAVALAVRVCIGSPVLFRQQRPGLGGRPFTMVKFRTMRDARDADGNLLPDEVRLGAFGRALRKTSLDELPELWNVLRGEMSLVGPRPLLMEYLPRYNARQSLRHAVRPGITGWAQVNGRNALDWPARLEMDAWYVENRTFALDIRILMLTVLRVVRPVGISQPGHATMQPFSGNQQPAERAA